MPRVLVVDDDADNVETTAMLLELGGAWVDRAFSGNEAIERARSNCPDVIVLDLLMPAPDGYAVAEQLQCTPLPYDPLLIAVSGRVDHFRCAQAGFDLALTKPVDVAVLQHALVMGGEARLERLDSERRGADQRPALDDLIRALAQMAATRLQVAASMQEDSARLRMRERAAETRKLVTRQLLRREPPVSVEEFILGDITARAVENVGADMATLQLLTPEGRLEIRAQQGLPQSFVDHYRSVVEDDSCACAQALRTGSVVEVDDVESDERFAGHRSIARLANVRAVASVPFASPGGQMIGVLSTHFTSPRRFGRWERETLGQFASRCGAEIAWATG